MSGHNRGRYVVAVGGAWRLYTHPLPDWTMLGTIQRGTDIGALGESRVQVLAQINTGIARSLDQRKARAALAAARREHPMTTQPIGITIPDDLEFADLKLARDPASGDISFDWAPIQRICEASGIDIALFRNAAEDNVAGLLTAWYRMHRAGGGAPDTVQEDLIEEARLEDERGAGLSHPPGRA